MQIVYFKSKIESNPDWELVKIYQDYGISGTSTNKRQGFKDMIDDAKAGKIDLILTKGINRFGRNTVDILNNLRTLNALTPPVPVRFESEGLSSIGDGSNNLLIAVLSALAELESQQKSEAIKNGIRWRMAEGIYQFSVINTLGYYWDHFGRLLIEPTEAKIVEYIYESCLEGATPAEIAAALTEQGIKSPKGKDFWRAATIRGILRNEKYCGDALMQKTCTIDFREHKSVKNTMLNKYFKEEHHTAIIKNPIGKGATDFRRKATTRQIGKAARYAKAVHGHTFQRQVFQRVYHFRPALDSFGTPRTAERTENSLILKGKPL